MNDAVIYARISTGDKYQNISQQKELCKKFCLREGFNILHIIGDKISGKIPLQERPGGKRLLKLLKENNKIILVVQDIDRISRDFYDAVYFEKFILKNKIIIKSLSETIDLNNPMGKFSFRIKMAMNSFYLENLHEKIKVGVARAREEGKYKGRKRGSKNKKNNSSN